MAGMQILALSLILDPDCALSGSTTFPLLSLYQVTITYVSPEAIQLGLGTLTLT